jgi:hypothetical protein
VSQGKGRKNEGSRITLPRDFSKNSLILIVLAAIKTPNNCLFPTRARSVLGQMKILQRKAKQEVADMMEDFRPESEIAMSALQFEDFGGGDDKSRWHRDSLRRSSRAG